LRTEATFGDFRPGTQVRWLGDQHGDVSRGAIGVVLDVVIVPSAFVEVIVDWGVVTLAHGDSGVQFLEILPQE
jgi:hypothetical protein